VERRAIGFRDVSVAILFFMISASRFAISLAVFIVYCVISFLTNLSVFLVKFILFLPPTHPTTV